MTEDPYKAKDSDNKKYRQAEEALRESEARYRSLFENSPTSLWEEDFTAVKIHIDHLKESGVKDFRVYFDEHPEDVSKYASLVKILDINNATIELLEAKNKEEVFVGLPKIFTKKSLDIFKEELIALSEGKRTFESEAPHLTLKGNVKNVFIKLTLIPEYSKTWSKLFISITDITELKNIEEDLIASQSNLETLFNSIYDYIFVLDMEGNILRVNQKVVDHIGYSEKDMLNMHVLDFHPPERRKEAASIVADMIAGKTDSCNVPIQTSDGKLIPVETKISKGFWGNQEVLFGISRDITERIKAEKKIRESEEKFRTIAEQSLMGVAIIQDNVVKYINQQLSNLLGYPIEEMLNWQPGEFLKTIHPDDRQMILEQAKRRDDESETGIRNYVARGVHRSGRIIWLDVWYKTIKYQNRNAFITTYIDITEKRKAEESLRESEEKYRYLFENAPSSILLIDSKGTIRDVNPKVVELTGYKREELIGKNYIELSDSGEPIAEKYIPRLIKRLDKLIQGQKLPSIELKIKTKNGKLLWFNFQTNVINIGDEIFLQTIGHDITEERKTQDNLIKASNQANFYKDLFAHDMKNILTVISGSAELYSFYKDNSDKLKEIDNLFDMIREQTNRGAQLISNVQKLSTIEESRVTLEKTDLNKILNDAIEFILSSYKNREIKIDISAKEAKYYAQANELLLDVFENILINSVKHNDNPTVEIQIKISKEKRAKKKYLKIEFIDNGMGIPDARKETIFQRVSNQQRSTIGMGIGLSLVKFLIDSYNGDVLVEDTIRGNYTKGSNFIVFIPEAILS